MRIFLFAEAMILYTNDIKNYLSKLIETINIFSKLGVYDTN